MDPSKDSDQSGAKLEEGEEEKQGLTQQQYGIDEGETLDPTYELDDFSTKLLTENFVYNDCTVPFREDADKSPIFVKSPISTCLGVGAKAAGDGEAHFTMVDLGRVAVSPQADASNGADDSDELGLAQARYSHKPSVRGDMIHSINSLRLNVNNHIIGGSKNVMQRMRKLSISDLNKRNKPTNRKYQIAFYTALCTLSFLFLYLIYQNLFNDR